MSEVKAVPGVHEHLLEFFPSYNYRQLAPGIDPARISMRHPQNVMGHQQRAFSVWWALKMGGPLDLGLDIGSHRGLTPYAIHVDSMYTGEEHPIYGGRATCDVIADGGALLGRFPKNTFPFIVSNHSLEHMPVTDDEGVIRVLSDWLSLLRPGGVLAMVVPDDAYFDVLGSDRNHFHAWTSGDVRHWRSPNPVHNFKRCVLDPFLARNVDAELVEYDTLQNNFSYNVVMRRK